MFTLTTLFTHPLLFVVGFLALAVSITVHEFAHVLAAYLQGDQTGKMLGRLSLNPLRHLDPWGTIAIVLAGIGWGRPAPYNPFNLRYRRWGPLFVALAGPISNLVIVLLAGYALVWFGGGLPSGNLLLMFLQTLVILNAALAVFNLIPVVPLDGSQLILAVLGPNNPVVVFLQRYGVFILLGILVLAGNWLSLYITSGVDFVLRVFGLGGL